MKKYDIYDIRVLILCAFFMMGSLALHAASPSPDDAFDLSCDETLADVLSKKENIEEDGSQGQQQADEQALLKALRQGDKQTVKTLLCKGIELSFFDEAGTTPLIIAVTKEYSEIVTMLLGLNADPDQADVDGDTPLSIAIEKENKGIFTDLLRAHADVNLTDNDDVSPLLLAVRHNREDFVIPLLCLGANARCHNKQRQSPLSEAIKLGSLTLVRMLVKYGAKINDWLIYNGRRMSLIKMAKMMGHKDIVAFLEDKLQKSCNYNDVPHYRGSLVVPPYPFTKPELKPLVTKKRKQPEDDEKTP